MLSDSFDVVCAELVIKRLQFGRWFWAEQPALDQWPEMILGPTKCWDDWKAMFTDEERTRMAEQWFGHWSLTGQVRNFLGLTTGSSERVLACVDLWRSICAPHAQQQRVGREMEYPRGALGKHDDFLSGPPVLGAANVASRYVYPPWPRAHTTAAMPWPARP